MENEKRLIDEFKSEVMSEFIRLCNGNDFNKLTLLRIGDTIDRIYERYRLLPAVEIVRCKDCMWYDSDECGNLQIDMSDCSHLYTQPDDFCSYGERRNDAD